MCHGQLASGYPLPTPSHARASLGVPPSTPSHARAGLGVPPSTPSHARAGLGVPPSYILPRPSSHTHHARTIYYIIVAQPRKIHTYSVTHTLGSVMASTQKDTHIQCHTRTGVGDGQHANTEQLSAGSAQVDVVCRRVRGGSEGLGAGGGVGTWSC